MDLFHENNFAHDSDTRLATGGSGLGLLDGLTNYLIYAINDCWGFGFRYEYFEDSTAPWCPGWSGGVRRYPSRNLWDPSRTT